jgi:hypothetical protein
MGWDYTGAVIYREPHTTEHQSLNYIKPSDNMPMFNIPSDGNVIAYFFQDYHDDEPQYLQGIMVDEPISIRCHSVNFYSEVTGIVEHKLRRTCGYSITFPSSIQLAGVRTTQLPVVVQDVSFVKHVEAVEGYKTDLQATIYTYARLLLTPAPKEDS